MQVIEFPTQQLKNQTSEKRSTQKKKTQKKLHESGLMELGQVQPTKQFGIRRPTFSLHISNSKWLLFSTKKINS